MNSFLNRGLAYIYKHWEELTDPLVGDKILELQKQTMLIRLDSRGLNVFQKQDGLQPRVQQTQIRTHVRHSHVINYQAHNQDPFLWGACDSLKDSLAFMNDHISHAQGSWIHQFYGKATSLTLLKCTVGMESEGLDKENEQMIIEHIPFRQFIASIAPDQRERFLKGMLVPNAMHDFNPELPKTVGRDDLMSEKNVLSWLLRHYSNSIFSELCQVVYGEASHQLLMRRFQDAPIVLFEIQRSLAFKKLPFLKTKLRGK